jgi:peptidyl-prolyl isomerase E (cyclophilin E)
MTNPKRTVYVGGLAEEVDEKTLQAAFIPFGKRKEKVCCFFFE